MAPKTLFQNVHEGTSSEHENRFWNLVETRTKQKGCQLWLQLLVSYKNTCILAFDIATSNAKQVAKPLHFIPRKIFESSIQSWFITAVKAQHPFFADTVARSSFGSRNPSH